jgi:ABC-type transport system involved in multi-copper enzyme maturation permease subunit
LRLRKGAWAWLLEKEWRELMAAPSWWILLAAMGPLVGFSFISSVRTYAEASGLGGTAAGVGEAFSPLIGVWAPTFSALELAAVFLLPFVAIRLVAGGRQSGAERLELQQPIPTIGLLAAKALILALGWLVASAPALVAVALWKIYGGWVYPPELAAVVLGHLLNAGLTIALAAVMSAVSEHPSTAAILTLGVTVGTWILNFVAAVNGGWWERVAGYTPTAMVAEFQHGLVRLAVVLVATTLTAAGLVFAAIWLRRGFRTGRRAWESVALAAVTSVVVATATLATPNWDLSEDRANSFSRADEAALGGITAPLRIEVHLAAEDPRRVDLEHRVLGKLRRVIPSLEVQYVSATSIGLFEQTSPHYGEIWYDLGGRRAMSRLTTVEGALEVIYGLARVAPPAVADDTEFLGHPLAVPPRGAAWVFYLIWPALVVGLAFVTHRRQR